MKLIKVTIDADGYEMMNRAAEFAGAPLSVWARMVLLKEARTVKHRIICTPKPASDETGYQWAGKPCTKEELAQYEKESAGAKARHNARRKEVDEMELH